MKVISQKLTEYHSSGAYRVRYGIKVYNKSGFRFLAFDQMPTDVAMRVYKELGALLKTYNLMEPTGGCSIEVRGERRVIGYRDQEIVYGIKVINGDGSHFSNFDRMSSLLAVKVYKALENLLLRYYVIQEGGTL
jgi:hypothetical protein